MKTNFTDLEKVVLKAIVESAHESGDNGVEFLLDKVVGATGMSQRSVQGVCSSLQKKGYIDCFSGEYYFDGMIHDNAEEWYKETFTQKPLVLSTPDQHYWNNNGGNEQELKRLTEKFMPASGRAENLVGEVIRAVNRLYYEFCNNGNGNAMDCHTIPGEWVECSSCSGSGYVEEYDEESDEWGSSECCDCGGEGGYYEDDEEEYTLNEFYGNFINLIREYFTSKNCAEGVTAICELEAIVENMRDTTDANMSVYDRVTDYAVWLVLNDEDNTTPIPAWYKNE